MKSQRDISPIVFSIIIMTGVLMASCSPKPQNPSGTDISQETHATVEVSQAIHLEKTSLSVTTRVPESTPAPSLTATLVPSETPTLIATNTPTPESTNTPTTAAPEFSRTLKLDSPRMSGDDVELMQTRLLELGYSEIGTADGIFGSMTQAAIIRFQTDNGLTADGIVGRITWAALWGVDTATAGPTPTREIADYETFKSPADQIKFLGWDGKAIWLVGDGNRIYRIDPNTQKVTNKYEFGCSVCYGPCELFAATMDGTQFWAFQYGNTAYNDCESNEPWKNIGFTLRMTDVANGSTKFFNLSDFAYKLDLSYNSMLVYDNRLWLTEYGTIYIIDLKQSSGDKVVISKTIYPVNGNISLSYFNGKVWAAGDSLAMIDPQTYQILIYPMDAESVTFDGQYIWGTDNNEMAVQSFDIQTRSKGKPIYLDDVPHLLTFDGKNLWITFYYSRDIAIIPIR